jgi:hypothetical protein
MSAVIEKAETCGLSLASFTACLRLAAKLIQIETLIWNLHAHYNPDCGR